MPIYRSPTPATPRPFGLRHWTYYVRRYTNQIAIAILFILLALGYIFVRPIIEEHREAEIRECLAKFSEVICAAKINAEAAALAGSGR
jgi:hypothetical protein